MMWISAKVKKKNKKHQLKTDNSFYIERVDYVANIQIMLPDMIILQFSQQFCPATQMLCHIGVGHHVGTFIHLGVTIYALLVWLFVQCYEIRHNFCCCRTVYYITLILWNSLIYTILKQYNDITSLVKVPAARILRPNGTLSNIITIININYQPPCLLKPITEQNMRKCISLYIILSHGIKAFYFWKTQTPLWAA